MNTVVRNAIVSDSFDDLRSKQVRFLEEAHKIGFVDVLLWSDKLVQSITGHLPKFPQEERLYCLQSLRYVDRVRVISKIDDPHSLPTQVWDELKPRCMGGRSDQRQPAKTPVLCIGGHGLPGHPGNRPAWFHFSA